MFDAAVFASAKRLTGRKSPAAVALTGVFKGFWKSGLALCLLLLAVPAWASTTWTVTSTSDSSSDTASLRYAIANSASGDTIDLSGIYGTITLTSSLPTISKNLTISGPGATLLTISGNNAYRIFWFASGTSSISGLTIANGYSSNDGGAGIYNAGTLTVSKSIFSGNVAATSSGGAIENWANTLTISNSTFYGNVAADKGGCIFNASSGSIVTAQANISNSTFYGNSAGRGGCFYNLGDSASASLNIVNSTIFGNTASSSTYGDAIYNKTGYSVSGFVVTVNLYNSIIIGSVYNSNGSYVNYYTNTTSSTGLKLSPLGWYGGPTPTMIPLYGSNAICAGSTSYGSNTDQRGFTRSTSCKDTGAVQTNWLTVTSLSDANNGSCTSRSCSSLRDAITQANTNSTGADVRFTSALTGTASVSASYGVLPSITGYLNLANLEGYAVTIDGGGLGSVLQVASTATAAISNLTLTNGSATTGGGIDNAGTLTVAGSTITGNTATTTGGGIQNTGTLLVDESTLTANTSGGTGGGVYNSGKVNVLSNTITANTASSTGGGIANSATATIANSIVEGNTSSYGANAGDCDSCGTQSSYNLINDSTSAVTPPTLGTLASNGTGAVTATMIPLPGSTAICAGSSSLSVFDTLDQRGFPRKNTSYTGYSSSSPCVDLGAVQTNYTGVIFATEPTDSVINTALATTPTVEVEETNTNTSTSVVNGVNDVPVTLNFSGGSSEISGTLTQTTSGGVATFSGLKINTIGTDKNFTTEAITVTSSYTLASVASSTFNVAGLFSGFSVVPASTTETMGATFTVTVKAIDAAGSTYTSYSGTPVLTSSDGQTVTVNSSSCSSGICNFNITLNHASNSLTLTATDTDYTGTSAAITVTEVLTLSPASGTLTGGQIAAVYGGVTFTTTGGSGSYSYAVTSGNLPAGLTLSSNTGVITGTPTQTGSFSFTITATDTTYTASSVSGSYSLTITSTPAVVNIYSGSDQTAYAGIAFASSLVALVADANGNPVPSQNVTFTAPSSGASLLFSNSATTIAATTDANGYVTVATPTANSTAGSYTVTATAGSASGSFSLTNQSMPTYIVTTLADDASGTASNCTDQLLSNASLDAACSLRDAIAAAASIAQSTLSTPTMPTINFSATKLGLSSSSLSAYSVATNGTLTLTGNMQIVGPGAGLLSIDGGSAAQVFAVNSGVTASLSGLTIANGYTSTGGGINNAGTLTVTNSTFSANNADSSGGAILNDATLKLTNSTFSVNNAPNGGAIVNNGILTATNSTFSANNAPYGGGAIFNYKGTLTATNSTFSANNATEGSGGAIYGYYGTLTVTNSAFSANNATDSGGAILNAGTANVDSNVFYNNLANGSEDDCNSCTTNTNAVSGDPMLATLGSYGGPTQTMIPLPGSSAICAGAVSNIPSGLTTDQRGYARSTTYDTACVDAGAVQTNYSLSLAAPAPVSPATAIVAGTAFTDTATLNESGSAFSGASATLPALTFTGTGTLSGSASVTTQATNGTATYTGLSISAPGSGDVLTVTLPLNSSLSTAPSITASTSSFTVNSPLSLSPASGTLTGGQVAAVYAGVTFTTTGGSGNYSYAMTSGSLPTGLSLTNGVLQGTPIVRAATSALPSPPLTRTPPQAPTAQSIHSLSPLPACRWPLRH